MWCIGGNGLADIVVERQCLEVVVHVEEDEEEEDVIGLRYRCSCCEGSEVPSM